MKMFNFIQSPISHNLRDPHSKALEPDRLSPPLAITTQPQKGGAYGAPAGRCMKTFLKIVLVLAVQSILVSSAFAQFFTIEKFHSDITIHPDASFTVTETIDVHFSRPRHGIYREIPFKYRDDLGHMIRTPTHVLSVTDGSGKKWKTKISKKGNVVNIRIGDIHKYVQGQHLYTITYRVENAILFFSDHD